MKYYIVYQYSVYDEVLEEICSGIQGVFMQRDRELNTQENIVGFINEVCRDNSYKNIIILNIIKLKG